jgi:hypothetical protein
VSTLLVSGDSWTSCWPLEEKLGHRLHGWPNLVAEHFNFDLIDKSRAGSSNYRIYRKAFDGIVSGNVDHCLVFLTSWTRLEVGAAFGEKPGGIYQWIPSQQTDTVQYQLIFKHFFNGYKNYTDMIRMIISLQSLSKTYSVPCWFMNTFDDTVLFNLTLDKFKSMLSFNPLIFDNMDDKRIQDKFLSTKKLLEKVDTSAFISAQSYQSIIQDCPKYQAHPTELGHKKISNLVIQFLERHIHGKTI